MGSLEGSNDRNINKMIVNQVLPTCQLQMGMTELLPGSVWNTMPAHVHSRRMVMSELGRETVSAYAAAKGGLKMLTKNIASEYGAYNIQCNGIGPGYIATPQTAPLREIQPDGSRHPFDQFIVAKTPAARWGNAEDLGGPAVFLASEASDFVNGLILGICASRA